jgi:hypothetical protein
MAEKEHKPILIYRHQLKEGKDGRWSGHDWELGGFFLVDKESDLGGEVFDATVVRRIIDKRGKEVPIVRLTPHEHRFEPHHLYPETHHRCPICRETERHRAVCPNRHCEDCGIEIEPTHRFERYLGSFTRVADGGRKLEEVAVLACVNCNEQTAFITDVFLNPFYPKKVFHTFEELRDEILKCEEQLPYIPPPPAEPKLERRTVASELALQRWRLETEQWADELSIEQKVAIAAAVASEETERGSREWVKGVGEILSFYNAVGLANALRRLVSP